ncbi:2'-5' RNA ligase family protein [Flavobacterium sp. 5]|uniref:2'-5' RNA ligase family protein n=1 Tax=Flavobacterium sp. 5 TaxID=2035199 RepID=UPI000C2B7A52|nr:2'-5' RNA ligase family protein [Flavobacterium sp. 5]PKB15355.1 2'-5' RNA ligase [Flavobacterium sp. 5]
MHNKKLNKVYQDLYHQAYPKILKGEYSIDEKIDNALDQRFGMTLLIRPQIEVKNDIQKFLNELKILEPEQYYYPNSDLHITVLSIISCYVGFNLENISVSEYSKIISKSLESINEFEIEFKGITASESAIMIQGFPKDNTLNTIRENLRDNFSQSILQQSIDKRYPLITAHITVIRFKEKLKDVASFMNYIEKYKNHDFGTLKVDSLYLVYNDWYQKKQKVQQLMKFKI